MPIEGRKKVTILLSSISKSPWGQRSVIIFLMLKTNVY